MKELHMESDFVVMKKHLNPDGFTDAQSLQEAFASYQCALMRHIFGLTIDAIKSRHAAKLKLMTSSTTIIQNPRLNDGCKMITRVVMLGGRMTFEHEIFRNGTLLANSTQIYLWVCPRGNVLTEVAKSLLESLRQTA